MSHLHGSTLALALALSLACSPSLLHAAAFRRTASHVLPLRPTALCFALALLRIFLNHSATRGTRPCASGDTNATLRTTHGQRRPRTPLALGMPVTVRAGRVVQWVGYGALAMALLWHTVLVTACPRVVLLVFLWLAAAAVAIAPLFKLASNEIFVAALALCLGEG